jgi:hypothetical protein
MLDFRGEIKVSSGGWMDGTNRFRGGAASLNDMKDMLADLPQYQEQREQVW